MKTRPVNPLVNNALQNVPECIEEVKITRLKQSDSWPIQSSGSPSVHSRARLDAALGFWPDLSSSDTGGRGITPRRSLPSLVAFMICTAPRSLKGNVSNNSVGVFPPCGRLSDLTLRSTRSSESLRRKSLFEQALRNFVNLCQLGGISPQLFMAPWG
jgi:hypothetical protein